AKVLGRVLRPEPERVAHVEDLGEHGLVGRLAVLLDDRLRNALAVVNHPLAQVVEHLGAAVEAECRPHGLGGAGAVRECLHLRGIEIRHAGDRLPGGGVLDLYLRSFGGGAPTVPELIRLGFDRRHAPSSLVATTEGTLLTATSTA